MNDLLDDSDPAHWLDCTSEESHRDNEGDPKCQGHGQARYSSPPTDGQKLRAPEPALGPVTDKQETWPSIVGVEGPPYSIQYARYDQDKRWFFFLSSPEHLNTNRVRSACLQCHSVMF